VSRGVVVPWAYPALAGALLASAITTGRPPQVSGLELGVAVSLCAAVLATLRLGPSLRRGAWACLAAALASGVNGAVWSQRPDTWTPQLGAQVRLAGSVDGRLLRVAGHDDLVLRGQALAPGRVEVIGTLEPLAERRNPGGFDEAGFWHRRGVRAAIRIESVEESAPPSGLLAWRERLRAGVVAGVPSEAAALQQALTLGVRYDLGALRAQFAAAGLAHVLALSGLHVGVLAGAVAVATRRLGRRRSGVTVLLVTAAYIAVVGPGPSVARAGVMLGFVVLARQLGVAAAPLPVTLALAAVTLLIARPAWVGDLGFQLSFVSVAGIAWLAGPYLERHARLPSPRSGSATRIAAQRLAGWLAAGVATSVAAQAATLSLVASGFGAVPLLAPLVNLAALPLATLLVPLGAAAGLAGLVHIGAAAAVNAVTAPVAQALLALAASASRGPSLAWGEIDVAGHLLAGCALVAIALALQRVVRWRSALAVVVCAAGVAYALPDRWGVPELVVLDVGQGDAIVLRLGGGAAVLIDAGGVSLGGFDAGAGVVVPALRALGVWRLPLVIASHPDLDHVGGLPAVVAALPVGVVWFGHAEQERPAWAALERVAAARGVPLQAVARGDAVAFGDVRIEVLHPSHEPLGESNADSVAVLLRYRGAAWALLLGDVPAHVEAELPLPPTPLLLAPHHGSATSTSAALLRAAQPRLVLVSVGRNRYGHPAAAVVERIEAHGAALVSTLQHGALRHRPGAACVSSQLGRHGEASMGTC